MVFFKRSMSRKARILLVCGTLCLAFGGGLPVFVHPPAGAASLWFDGVRGLLLGAAIGLNFSSAMIGKSERRRPAGGTANG